MDTRFRIYLGVLVALLVLYAVAESQRPPELRWDHTYQNQDKIPFGTYALVELLPDLFETDEVTISRAPVSEQIAENSPAADEAGEKAPSEFISEISQGDTIVSNADSTVIVNPNVTDTTTAWISWTKDASNFSEPPLPARASQAINYVFISPQVNFDSLDTEALLRFVSLGHHVFIAADGLPPQLLKRLNLSVRQYAPSTHTRDSVRLFINGDSTSRAYRFAASDIGYVFRQLLHAQRPKEDTPTGIAPCVSSINSLAVDSKNQAVLVSASYGFGDITLCSVPTAFTNYFVLRPATAGFAWQALSSLPRGPVWWDEYSKQGRAGSDSLLRVVFKYPALKLAFWLLLGGGLLLLWVGGRRRQRVIPVVKPLPNNTLQFVRTVAGLYRQGDNHAAIAHRKIDLFLDFLRTRYKAPTDDLNAESFRALLAQKAGLPRADVDELLRRLNGVRASSYVSDGELLWLSQTLSEVRKR